MTREQDSANAAATPTVLLWSRLVQGAAAVVIVLSLTLLLSPRLGEAIFNLVYFHQLSIPVEVPSLAHGYIWFANGIIGAVMAGWMTYESNFLSDPAALNEALASSTKETSLQTTH